MKVGGWVYDDECPSQLCAPIVQNETSPVFETPLEDMLTQ